MPETNVDVVALYTALDRARDGQGLSWREVARRVGVSASTMSRLAQGLNPDINAFARMVRWLNVPAETYISEDGHPVTAPADAAEGDLVEQIGPLLRARRDLAPQDIEFLEELIGSAVRRFKAESPSRTE